MSEPDIAAVLATAMDAENRRRSLAGASPGLGPLAQLPQVSYGPSVGKSGLDLPAVGEGLAAIPYAAQTKSYGPRVPVYADPAVAGVSYPFTGSGTALRALGERVFAAQDRAAARGAVEFVSAQDAPRRSLWSRLLGRLRHRR